MNIFGSIIRSLIAAVYEFDAKDVNVYGLILNTYTGKIESISR